MSDHDPFCLWEDEPRVGCICDLIARVRADERERWGLGWVAAADNVQALAHAEAVAARLVEVICRQEADADRRVDRMILRGARQVHEARAELDAAVDQAARLTRDWRAAAEERDAARAEVEQRNKTIESLRRQLAYANLESDEHADSAVRRDERLRELAKTNFDLYAEAKKEQREARTELDLARAEVARLEDLLRLSEEAADATVAEALAEVAAMREHGREVGQAHADAHTAVLAALRAKMAGLPTANVNGYPAVYLGDALALLDEARP